MMSPNREVYFLTIESEERVVRDILRDKLSKLRECKKDLALLISYHGNKSNIIIPKKKEIKYLKQAIKELRIYLPMYVRVIEGKGKCPRCGNSIIRCYDKYYHVESIWSCYHCGQRLIWRI